MCWMKRINRVAMLAALTATLTFAGCAPTADGDGDPDGNNSHTEQEDRFTGQTDFVSADGRNGEATQENTDDSQNNDGAADADAGAPADESGRTVEQGDIYRVMTGDDYVLNLNRYRGLQIIDFSDPSDPTIIGRARMTGTPVEMYQVGDRVFALMNNWRGYYGNRTDLLPTQYQGGMVMVIDVSDPTDPVVTGQGQVSGHIKTSRLTRGNNQEALFVVANEWAGGGQTWVKSFSVSSQGALEEASELQLGGYVGDIQATPERLMVARNHYGGSSQNQTQVTLIDISDPTGTMVEGDSVQVRGRIHDQFNMHIEGDIMRLVSGNSWSSSTNTNHLETFDVSDIHNIAAIDHDTFGDNEDLYATLFMKDRAFFVTYRRVDPFHAFSIDENGNAVEESEFVISGWNDYFQQVWAGSRLVGIGKNDENGTNTMAVSLYDITDLSNPSPLIDRQEVELDHSWSEAQWDHRAYSVIEKGTNVQAPTGEQETGLVLLPFSGWDPDEDRYVSAVQIFTFSQDTLTLRGTMDHGTRVRRSFVADRTDSTTANLSEEELSFFDTTDPDTPQELGRVDLAPNYSAFWVMGDYGVRRRSSQRYGYYYYSNAPSQTDSLQVISLADDPDITEPLTSIEIPSRANVYQVGDLLVTAEQTQLEQDGASSEDRPDYETSVEVWDFSMPTSPTLAGQLTTTDIEPSSYYYGDRYGEGDCFDCGYYYGPSIDARVIDDALVFVTSKRNSELVGTEHYRRITAQDGSYYDRCYSQGNYDSACTYYSGGVTCRQLERVDGTVEPEVCTGTINRCERDEDGERSCTSVDRDDIATEEYSRDQQRYRSWNHYEMTPLDLSTPAQPTLADPVTMPEDEDDVSLLARGDSLYITHRERTEVPADNRPYVRYYFKRIDLSQPANPQVQASINIPGDLIEVDGDTIVTRDYMWGEHIVETSINKLLVNDGLAYLKGTKRYRDRQVQQVALDGAGNILVSHQEAWITAQETYDDYYAERDDSSYLSILDLDATRLPERSEIEVDRWARLRDARVGRALFSVPGGLLVLNIDDVTSPYAQAYFPTQGWSQHIVVDDDDIYFSAGRYGMYKFGLDETNLLSD